MKTEVDIDFTPGAEIWFQGESGIHRYEFEPGELPNIGDTVRLRKSPSNTIADFVCTARLWDFSEAGIRRLVLTLDFQ